MATPNRVLSCQCTAVVITAAFRTALSLFGRIGTSGAAVLLSGLDLTGASRMRTFVAGHGISRSAHILQSFRCSEMDRRHKALLRETD